MTISGAQQLNIEEMSVLTNPMSNLTDVHQNIADLTRNPFFDAMDASTATLSKPSDIGNTFQILHGGRYLFMSKDDNIEFKNQFIRKHEHIFENVASSLLEVTRNAALTDEQKKEIIKNNMMTTIMMSKTFDLEFQLFKKEN